MRLYRCFSTFAWVLSWSVTTAKTYQNEELVLDSTVTGDTSFTEDEQLVLDNAKITLKNYSAIHLTSGVILTGNSLLNIETTSGNNVKYSLTINGEVKLDQGSQFIFDGSSLKYSDSKQAYELFNFDINSDENGLFISKDSSMKVTVPKLDSNVDGSIDIGSIHIGGTYKAPYNSPIVILGKLEMLSPEQTVDNKFPLKYWRLDLGTDRIDEAGIYKRKNDLSGIISCEGVIGIYADIFSETTDPKIYTLGYIGYSIVSPLTIDLAKGPMIGPSGFLFLNVFPKGQDGIKFVNADLYSPNINDVDTTNMLFSTFYDSSYQHVDITSEQNAITIRSGLDAIATYYSDRHYNIINHCSESSNSIRGRYPSILLGGRTCSVFLTKQQKNSESNGLGSDSNSSIPEQKDETGSIPSGPDMDGGPGPHPGGSDTAGGPGPNPNGSDTAGGPGPNPNGSDTAGGPGPNPNGSDTAGGSGSGGSGSEGDSGEGGSGSGEGGLVVPTQLTMTITVDGEEIIEVVHITTYTDSEGHTITSTYTEMFKTLIDAEPQYVGETTQTITTTDTEGHTTTITTTYNIDNNGNTVPIVHSSSNMSSSSSIISSSISSAVSTPSGQDYTITTTGSDGKIETDIVSHITTTVNGKPTTITTTVPCDVSADKDRTTTVTHSSGVIETNVVSHITTTVNGKPTTITTTVPC
ncbi:hypothetical protein AO442_003852, partial [Nakaseomyces glabratus]